MFHARAFSSCGKQGPLFIVVRGPLFIAVRGPLTITAPPVAGHRLQTRRLSSCGSRAQLLHSMWDLPRPGLEPVSPALAGRLSTTAPPGKPQIVFYGTSLAVQQLRLCLPVQGVQVRSLVGELGSHLSPNQETKTWNRSNIVTNSINTLKKMVHIKNKFAFYSLFGWLGLFI